MKRLMDTYRFWAFISYVPNTFERYADALTSMVWVMFSCAIGIPALRELGVIHSLLWNYLIIVPLTGALVVVRKMRECHREQQCLSDHHAWHMKIHRAALRQFHHKEE